MSQKALTTYKTNLSNGVIFHYSHTPTDPVSACHIFLPCGSAFEPDNKSGVGTLTWALLSKGTKQRSAKDFVEELESLGASVHAGTTHDYTEISGHAISEFFPKVLHLMAEAMFSAGNSESEFEKEKNALLAGIRSKKESIFTLASEQFNSRMYKNHAYARPASGNEATVSGITISDIIQWRQKAIIPHGAIISIASSMPHTEILNLVGHLFGEKQWSGGKTDHDIGQPPVSRPFNEEKVVLKERFEQAFLIMGFPAPGIGHKDYIPLKLLNGILGGGMSARMFQELREKQGLAYDVGTYFPTKKKGSAFVGYMGLQQDVLKLAQEGMMKAFQSIIHNPIPQIELEHTKEYIKGSYILDHQTNSQRSHYFGWWEMIGLGSEYDGKYIKDIEAVTAEDISRAAQSWLSSPPLIVEVHPKKSAKKPASPLASAG